MRVGERHWAGACASRGALAAPRSAAAGGPPRRPRGTLEGSQRAIQRPRPWAGLRPTTQRGRCGSCGHTMTIACQVVYSPESTHARSTTACKWPPVDHGCGANAGTAQRALTRPTGIGSASARALPKAKGATPLALGTGAHALSRAGMSNTPGPLVWPPGPFDRSRNVTSRDTPIMRAARIGPDLDF